jgi:HSP20 family protein
MKPIKHNRNKTQPLTPVSGGGSTFWPLSRWQTQIDQLFEESFDRWLEPTGVCFEGWSPGVDMFEDKENVVVKTELPGMKKDEIELYMTGNSLNIAGEKKEEAEYKTGEAHRVERYFGHFHRCVSLPCSVDSRRIEAHYKDGVLTVSCPKTEEAKKTEVGIEIT